MRTRRTVDVRPAAGATATAFFVLLLLSIVLSVLLTIALNALG